MKRALPALTMLVLASACSGSGTPSAAESPQPTLTVPPPPSPAACASKPGKAYRWPAGIPADLPMPPGSSYVSSSTSADRVTIVRLTSTLSLQQSVLFVLKEVNKAGYTLGRGDAEPAEADAPFGKGDLRGIYKMVGRDLCVTDWLVAAAKVSFGNNSPVLPTASRGPSSSPLPFG
ncbi:MAG: hypothetical protein JWO22_2826 [Frankiales bacterium]|nr:hypothetical protein [Frankiales bacterium]